MRGRSSVRGRSLNDDYLTSGSSCIAERRAIEMLDNGAARTPIHLRFGARVRISAIDEAERSPLGAIDQRIVTSRLGGVGAADGTV